MLQRVSQAFTDLGKNLLISIIFVQLIVTANYCLHLVDRQKQLIKSWISYG